MYTSGSTGTPKGVVETHRNVMYEAAGRANTLGLSHNDRMICTGSFGFSVSLRQLFPALMVGACSCRYDLKRKGVARLPDFVAEERLTILSSRAAIRQMAPLMTGEEQGRIE